MLDEFFVFGPEIGRKVDIIKNNYNGKSESRYDVYLKTNDQFLLSITVPHNGLIQHPISQEIAVQAIKDFRNGLIRIVNQ